MSSSQQFHVRIPDYDIKDQEFVAYYIQVKALTEEAKTQANGVKSWCVSRRFSEFVRLRHLLQLELSTCLLPALPSKHDGANSSWHKFTSALHISDPVGTSLASLDSLSSVALPGSLTGRRFDMDLIDSRRQALELFLLRCLQHPRLATAKTLFTFLHEGSDWDELFRAKSPSLPIQTALSTPTHHRNEIDQPPINPATSDGTPVEQAVTKYATISASDFALRSQNLVASLQRLVDLRKQIKRRYQTVSTSNKKVADALHRWCPFEQQAPALADTVQILAHVFDSYCDLLGPLADETEIDERLYGHLRYASSPMELCSRQNTVVQAVATEKTKLGRLHNDLRLLETGTNPNLIPSVVGTVSSAKNSVLQNLKSVFGGPASPVDRNKSSAASPSTAEVEMAKDVISDRIQEVTSHLAELELLKTDFANSISAEYAFFEQQQSADLAATLRAYAALQAKRADKCRRLWERAQQAVLQMQATPSKAVDPSASPPKHQDLTPTSSQSLENVAPSDSVGQFLFSSPTSATSKSP
ncbi:hypothetical protein AAHC03_013687 [Spirometra sp. Aus1]